MLAILLLLFNGGKDVNEKEMDVGSLQHCKNRSNSRFMPVAGQNASVMECNEMGA